jgi:23S rRNA pseudouridine1911/1915/1917 synthase
VGRYTEPIAATQLELQLETGRTHQIRVHLAAIGHPVLGDARYGGVRRSAPVERMMLHAARLGFVLPETGEPVEFVSPLPPAFERSLAIFS